MSCENNSPLIHLHLGISVPKQIFFGQKLGTVLKIYKNFLLVMYAYLDTYLKSLIEEHACLSFSDFFQHACLFRSALVSGTSEYSRLSNRCIVSNTSFTKGQ